MLGRSAARTSRCSFRKNGRCCRPTIAACIGSTATNKAASSASPATCAATACPAHCIDIVAAPSPWPDREKYPETFVIDELRCIYCGMCEEACPVDAIELTSLFDLTGLSREEMMFDKEKLLSVFDQTKTAGADPVRTHSGKLGPASEIAP